MDPSEPTALSGEVWPAHPQPRAGELLSSWLARLAHANGVSPQVLCALEWPGRRILHLDLERNAPADVLERLARRGAVSAGRLAATTLGALAGRLYEVGLPQRRSRWLLPWSNQRGKARSKRGGCQFCPECLAEDGGEPYLRLSWRLSFTTACARHHRLLSERCPRCQASLSPFWCAVSARGKPAKIPVSACRRCGSDLRKHSGETRPAAGQGSLPASDPALAFQLHLHSVVEAGWTVIPGQGPVYSHLYFAVIAQLLKLLIGAGAESKKFSTAVRREYAGALPSLKRVQAAFFDGLPATERHALLGAVGWLLVDWPERLIDVCRKARVTATTMLEDMGVPPFWFESIVQEALSVQHARWRDPTRPKQQQISYRVLGMRRTSRRLAAQEKRIAFTRSHPELWAKPRELAKAMQAAGLYSQKTFYTQIAEHCPRIVALAKNPDEWWRGRDLPANAGP